MFGLSFGEIVIIAVLALLLLGPDKLPDAAKTLAKGLKELRRASDDLKDQLGTELGALEDAKRSVTGALVGAMAAAIRSGWGIEWSKTTAGSGRLMRATSSGVGA